MNKLKTLDLIWLLLMVITVINAIIAESAGSGVTIIILVALSVAYKGQMVVDHFMGLKNANRYFRAWMNAYFIVLPTLTVLVYVFPENIAAWTSLQ